MCPPYDGGGSYSAPSNSWNPAVDNTDISTTDWASILADLSTALSTVICKDGQTTTTAIIPFADGIKTDTLSPVTSSGPISLTAGQLEFPATQNASSNPNTMDDYEEGTFVPTLTGSGGNPTVTYVTQLGNYTKIGARVFIEIEISVSNITGGSGVLQITGMPFASSTSAARGVGGAVYNGLTTSNAAFSAGVEIINNVSVFNVAIYSITNGNYANANVSDAATNFGMRASFSYLAAS